ncbi:hypothetical protein [Polaribacter gangjinensis]|uniref:Uncharacterized protein n=1 Tax=Polaribacter gangjinensis TaxID=574710 RepID=A0A2S7WEH1_9FLAO|nr:hypothetical protein [Polaribacter gangjinensis]PQJ76029.1 hypothetical protein BTO13_12695 [Polaribacter gangjinensis]
MRELIQNKNFVKRELRITDSKLFYTISKFGNGNEIDIPFENLNGEKVSQKSTNNILLMAAGVFFLIAIATQISLFRGGTGEKFAGLIWAGIGVAFLVIYYLSKQDFWKIRLTNDSYIYIHKNIPSKTATDQFLSELMKSRNEFLKENYAIVDENLSYESQLNNFKWLKSIDAISKDEFEQKYTELKQSIKQEKPNIGFGK